MERIKGVQRCSNCFLVRIALRAAFLQLFFPGLSIARCFTFFFTGLKLHADEIAAFFPE
jgi:hypothetical protein